MPEVTWHEPWRTRSMRDLFAVFADRAKIRIADQETQKRFNLQRRLLRTMERRRVQNVAQQRNERKARPNEPDPLSSSAPPGALTLTLPVALLLAEFVSASFEDNVTV